MNLTQIREILRFTGTLEEGIERVKEITEEFRRKHYSPSEEKKGEIGPEGRELLDIIKRSSFDEYTGGLLKVLSTITVPNWGKAEEMVHPVTGEEGHWIPSFFSEPSLYEVWEREKDSPYGKKLIIIEIGTMVVLLARNNDHDYPLNKPILVIKEHGGRYGRMGLEKTGRGGNYLPSYKDELRPATPDEIDQFFQSFPKE